MIDCCIQGGRTTLHLACENSLKDVALMLIERGANATEKDKVRVMTDDS